MKFLGKVIFSQASVCPREGGIVLRGEGCCPWRESAVLKGGAVLSGGANLRGRVVLRGCSEENIPHESTPPYSTLSKHSNHPPRPTQKSGRYASYWNNFESDSDYRLCMLCRLWTTKFSDSPLVRHLLISWRPAWQPSRSYPRSCEQTLMTLK